MSLKLVPFNSKWVTHDKLDVHAIYRRPRYRVDEYGERVREYGPDGVPLWDLTGPLPVNSHDHWVEKGFEYVTLADRVSLFEAAKHNTITDAQGHPCDWRLYDQHTTGGPWNYRKYMEGQAATTTREAEQLKADVERFGSEAVETIRRQTDPSFALPPHLRNVAPGDRAAKVEPRRKAVDVAVEKAS